MAYPPVILADTPVGYWRMGGASGAIANLGSAPGALTLTNATRNVAGAITDDDGAAQFNGSSARGQAVVDLSGSSRTATFEAWVWIDAYNSTADNCLAEYTAAYFNGGGFFIDLGNSTAGETGTISFGFNIGGFTRGTIPQAQLPVGGWHHLVAVFDGSVPTVLVYVDGAAKTVTMRQTASGGGSFSVGDTLNLMARNASALWTAGRLDEVAVYTHVLSPTRVAAHYAAGSATILPVFSGDAVVSATGDIVTTKTSVGGVGGDFPAVTETIDNFDRPDQNPPGSPWAATNETGTINTLGVVANRLAAPGAGYSGWIPGPFGPDLDLVVNVPVRPASAVCAVFLRSTDAGTGDLGGYTLAVTPVGGASTWKLGKWDGVARRGTTFLQVDDGPGLANGDSWGVRLSRQQFFAYHRKAGQGWTRVAVVTVDGSFEEGGALAFEVWDTAVRFDNLAGGTIDRPRGGVAVVSATGTIDTVPLRTTKPGTVLFFVTADLITVKGAGGGRFGIAVNPPVTVKIRPRTSKVRLNG